MGVGFAKPYFTRLRIFAKSISYHYARLRELNPIYDNCPVRCVAPERDKKNGCPECDYTNAYKLFRKNYFKLLGEELTKEYRERGDIPEKYIPKLVVKTLNNPYSFESLYYDYRSLSEAEAKVGVETDSSPGGIGKDWNIRIFTGVNIIREERYKHRRQIQWDADKKREAEERSRNGGRGK